MFNSDGSFNPLIKEAYNENEDLDVDPFSRSDSVDSSVDPYLKNKYREIDEKREEAKKRDELVTVPNNELFDDTDPFYSTNAYSEFLEKGGKGTLMQKAFVLKQKLKKIEKM